MRGDARRAVATGLRPGGADPLDERGGRLRRQAARRPADAVLHRPSDRRVGVATDEDGDPGVPSLGRCRAGPIQEWLPRPGPPEVGQLLVEQPAAAGEVTPGQGVVRLPPPDPEAQRQPPTTELLHGGGLFGQLGRAAGRRDQHVRQEPDPLGHRAGGGEDRELLVGGVGDRADRGQAGEAGRLGPSRPLEQLGTRGAPDAVGDADADLHAGSSPQVVLDQPLHWRTVTTSNGPVGGCSRYCGCRSASAARPGCVAGGSSTTTAVPSARTHHRRDQSSS